MRKHSELYKSRQMYIKKQRKHTKINLFIPGKAWQNMHTQDRARTETLAAQSV